jgi:hypothetical protein
MPNDGGEKVKNGGMTQLIHEDMIMKTCHEYFHEDMLRLTGSEARTMRGCQTQPEY